MSQVIPSPTLLSLEPGDKFLYAKWENNPYIDIHNAYLLVVDTTNFHNIRYIYLTEEEALDEAMKIDNLVNGKEYVVQYTQTQLAPDGIQGNSNTLIEAPIATPIAPTILNNKEYPIIIYTSGDHYKISLPVKYSFNNEPNVEETMFKIIYQDNEGGIDITTQTFGINLSVNDPDGNTMYFKLEDVYDGKYAISCFNVNVNGVGPLSNVIELNVGSKPFTADVTEVVSGLDGKLNFSVITSQNTIYGYNITKFNIYYAIPSSGNVEPTWLDGGYLDNLTVDNGYVTANGFVTGLTNGTKYLIKAVAENVNGVGLSGVEGKGVPAKQSTVSNVTITKAIANGGIVEANWTKINGTLGPTSYNYKLLDEVNNIIKQGKVTEKSISLKDLNIIAGEKLKLSVTPADTISADLLSYWVTPALQEVSDNWVGETVTTDLYTINSKPNPFTSFVCSSVGNGSLKYTFVKPVSFDYNAPTKYTIKLSNSTNFDDVNIVQSLDITDMTVSSKTFTDLINNVDYFAQIVASNDFGTSGHKSIGPNQPLLDINTISGLTVPTQSNTPISRQSPDIYDLTIDWDTFSQVGYSSVVYTVKTYTYNQDNTYTEIDSEPNITSSTYTHRGTLGTKYVFGVTVNAIITQFGTSISSAETKSVYILVSGAPDINPDNVKFGTQKNGNGTISFTVDDKYSALNGLFTLILPLSQDSVDEKSDVFQTQPKYYPLSLVSVNEKTYTANLDYTIPLINQAYVIYAVNNIGVTYIAKNLTN